MQAIITTFMPPTKTKGARVKACCAAGSLIVPWDDKQGVFYNHAEAARQLAIKLQWTRSHCGSLYGGSIPGGGGGDAALSSRRGYAFVFDSDAAYAGYAPDPVN